MAQQTRPPVVTILGHVDHGKTTLLDYIRQTNVQQGEAGGITQHIGAYQLEYQGKAITFIDTPGHAAFAKMRQRGAQITDLVVLVVAVNDSVKPQTIESIRHIKESNVSVIIAINKIDLKTGQPDTVKGELAEHDLLATDLGGEIEAVEISAKTGKGVDKLLETIVTMADLLELKADPQAPLKAVVVESSLDQHRGPIATVIVQQGALKVRQELLAPDEGITGRVKALINARGQRLQTVLPGCPAEIQGFNEVPAVGAVIHDAQAKYEAAPAEKSAAEAQEIAQAEKSPTAAPPAVSQPGADSPYADWDFDSVLAETDQAKLKLIIKADVKGTLEAILQTIDADSAEIIDSGVGLVTEGDVKLAEATGALILAFHTKVPKQIKSFAKQMGVKIKAYDIIYQLIEDLQKQMLKLMEPTINQVETGVAKVLQTFDIKGQQIAGCKVITGEIKKSDLFHLKREGEILASPVIASMQHGKEEVERVTAKSECGLAFKNKKLDFQVGDEIVAYYEADE